MRATAASAAVAWMLWAGQLTGWAQVRLPDGRIQQASQVQPVTDRIATRGIRRAEESIAAGEYSQAIQFLDQVLAGDEDKFVESRADGEYAGLKETARQMLRDLPPEGRQAYQAINGAAASRLLKQAVSTGDAAALQLAARRYFYTDAGFEAAFLLAMDEADAGQHLAAALDYQQLLESPEAAAKFDPHLSLRAAASWLAVGDEAQARQVLDALLARGEQTVQVAGAPRRLQSAGESIQWLRQYVDAISDDDSAQGQWLTYRGNAARNRVSQGGLPHMRVRWKVRLLGHPQLETLYENFAADMARSGNLAPIAGSPLAVGDYVLTRTPHGLLAVDFATGKRVWRSEPQTDPELKRLMFVGGATEEEAANPEPARSFARRIWEDYLYSLVSSDGARVYMIRDLPMPVAQEFEMSPFMGAAGIEEKGRTNRLSAYELATQGKLVWEIDGAAPTGELAGAYFLGAPLPVGEMLYVLAEMRGEVIVVALDRATGEVQWRQELARLESNIHLDLRRRLQAALPSCEGGILVCPIGGAVVSVDLAKRSLAWVYMYPSSPAPNIAYRGRGEDNAGSIARRWQDSSATIVAGRVLLTPPDSDELHCIDLRSGRLLWKQSRGDMTRLVAADDDRLLLVGNRRLRALNLEDGKPAWKKETLSLPRGVMPSGTGFISDGKYHLPLTSAEVIAVDMADGRIVSRATAREGAPLGNLICHRGTVISQSGAYLDCFDQIDNLRKRSEERLNKDPEDIEALRTLGEVAYNDGRLSEAISLLERAYRQNQSDVDVRDVLTECLAAALDEDFAAHRSHLPLLRELDDGGVARRMLIQRIEAQGLLQQGDPLASAAACLELYRLAGPPDEMLEIGRNHSVAVSRWVQAQLAAIWEQADGEARRPLTAMLEQEARKLGDQPSGDELARFLEFFGDLPMFQPLKLARTRELTERDQWLEAQQLLLDLARTSGEDARREAVGRIASHLHQAGLHGLAAEYDRQLAGPMADVPVLNGRTGRELLAEWDSAVNKPTNDWPRGKVKVATAPTTGAAATSRVRSPLYGIRLERTDSILGAATAHLSGRGGEIVLQDNLGREFFTAELEPETQMRFRHPGPSYGVSRGNLLVVSVGRQLAAFNTLASTEGLAPKLMWRVNLGSNLDYARDYYAEPSGAAASRPGSYRAPRPMDEGKWIGVIGPVTSRGVVFQDQRRLVCVDAITGEVRWSRTDVPQGCDLFGDDHYVFAVGTGKTSARVYSIIDGRFIGRRKVPEWRQQLATSGRRIICWKVSGNQAELSALDALTGDTLWRRDFESGAAVDVELGRYIAVVESQGRIAIVDGEDGKLLVDHRAPEKPVIEEIHLAVGSEDFLLAVKRPRPGNAERSVRAMNMADATVIDGELFVFERASGEMRWSRAAEVVQHSLLLTQPVDLPFILFAGVLTRTDGGGTQALTTMLILDKATGRTLFQSDELPQSGGGHCVARVTDAASHQAAVEMAGQTILLQFTDERRPPEPPAMAEVESSAGKTSRGLMGIILNLGGGR